MSDGSALVTGLILGLNLPASAPWWLALAGGAFAVLSCEEGTGTVVLARIPLTGELIAAGTVG